MQGKYPGVGRSGLEHWEDEVFPLEGAFAHFFHLEIPGDSYMTAESL